MDFEFLEPAEYELKEAVEFYNNQREGLGDEFAEEVKKTISRILLNPEAWTSISPKTRRCLTHRFPYGIIYEIREEMILIIAVMHLSRKPGYWKYRLQ